VKKITYEKNAKGKRVKQERWVEVQSKNPPEYVPVTCKFGSGFVRRGDLARFQQEAAELSGVYESETGRVWLQKSPNSPGKFSLVISNGNGADLAEFEAGNLEMKKRKIGMCCFFLKRVAALWFKSTNRVLTVSTKGSEEYKGKKTALWMISMELISLEHVVRKRLICRK
jgi:hypothetical protein